MIIDIPFHFGARVLLVGEPDPRPVALSGRECLHLASFSGEEAPVAVRWREPGGDWSVTREVEGRHAVPLAHPRGKAGARADLARLLGAGWEGCAADPLPDCEHIDISDWRLRRVLEDDKGRRVEGIRRRASLLCMVDGEPHVACDEPVLVEAGGVVEVRLGRALDWSRVHPLGEQAAACDAARRGGGAGALVHEVEVLRPGSLRVDRPFVLGRVARKALALVRRHCDCAAEARAAADAAEDALGREANVEAARAIDRCLAALALAPAAGQGVRDFAVRTRSCLAGHLSPAPAAIAA